ncbi:putative uncharacterized protein [Moritella viscosa]|nr:hypothetical protein [Moritella viscosa]CED59784.1 putative uncharacterized protein [Moritella viscosa]SHO03226.1 Site-specific recombinase, phage integrase family domain protein [Moritella viscosa]
MSLSLIKEIEQTPDKLKSLSKEDLSSIVTSSVNSDNMAALKVLFKNYTNVYNYDGFQPYWLKSDFYDAVWEIKFKGKSKRIINWADVTLNDGINLTHSKHQGLLSTIKLWINSLDNPKYTSGRQLCSEIISARISKILHIFNWFLLNQDSLSLSEQGLMLIDKSVLWSLIRRRTESDDIWLVFYDYINEIKKYLVESIKNISDDEANVLVDKYPHLIKPTFKDDIIFFDDNLDRIKACCHLSKIGYYTSFSGFVNSNGIPLRLFETVYKGRVINIRNSITIFDEFRLKEPFELHEYKNFNFFKDAEIDSVTAGSILELCVVLRRLPLITKEYPNDSIMVNIDEFKDINAKSILSKYTIKGDGRTPTLPAEFVFRMIKDTYEFVHDNMDNILSNVMKIIDKARESPTERAPNSYRTDVLKKYNETDDLDQGCSDYRNLFLHYTSRDLISEENKAIGVKNTLILNRKETEDRFERIRNNESLFHLYTVLIGSLQILIGAITARRQGEMTDLKPYGNLYPDINPLSAEGENTDYSVYFYIRKTGVNGIVSTKETVKRPVPRSLARFIYKLEQFNKMYINMVGGYVKNFSLFGNLNHSQAILTKPNATQYNRALSLACDYFETSIVNIGEGELRRVYIRQHMLRRFFAMVFFHTKRFKGLDTLRWMLAHSDIEHLHRYISETNSGKVLDGVKASVMVHELKNSVGEVSEIENLDKLEEVIAKEYGISDYGSVLVSTLQNAAVDYDDESYSLDPSLEVIKAQSELEGKVYQLLQNGVIDLQPTFFKDYDDDGNEINSYTLAMTVKVGC